MIENEPTILTINGGSSNIKFALFRVAASMDRVLHGRVAWDGGGQARLTFTDPSRGPPQGQLASAFDRGAAAAVLIDWLEDQPAFAAVRGVGHRLVHGMRHREPELATERLLVELQRDAPEDPEHLPLEISLLRAVAQRRPDLPQVVCFDTEFHAAMPRVARVLPIPRRYEELGVVRYGFHGLSYAYLMQELRRLGDPAATTGRVVLAHLGGGASMAAVLAGRSIDTSMGFTPASGLPGGTRSGDVDPGLVAYLARTEGMTIAGFQQMVHHESGLLGLSETSSDMRVLLEHEATDARAADAVDLFCYQAKKWIGALAAALGGLDTLVFSGGIGENAPAVRERACRGLGFLGIDLDERRNAAGEAVISSAGGRVTVRVIRTDEEIMIARAVGRVLGLDAERGTSS